MFNKVRKNLLYCLCLVFALCAFTGILLFGNVEKASALNVSAVSSKTVAYNGTKGTFTNVGAGSGAMAYVEFDSVYSSGNKYVIFQYEIENFVNYSSSFNFIDFGDGLGETDGTTYASTYYTAGNIYGSANSISIRMPSNPLLNGYVGKKITLIIAITFFTAICNPFVCPDFIRAKIDFPHSNWYNLCLI